MTAVRKELRRRRRPVGLAAMLLTLVGVLVFAFGASSTIGNSPFEAADGNLVSNGNPDWATVNEARKNDQPTGPQDDSFGQGTKEDTPVPTIVNGSIPNQKSDLKTFGVYNQTTAGGGSFMELFWTRVQEPNGTTNMDFEFNQSSVISANGVTPVRTAGDVLIQYDLERGGTVPTLSASRWVTTGPGSQCEANNAVPCWGTKVNLTAAGVATGAINTSPIAAADSDGLGALGARTFGEAEVDLSVLGGGGGHCFSFGSAYLKSRSSASFTAEVKDFIAPETINVGQCGHVIIRKITDPVSDPALVQFGYTKDIDTDPATANTFTLGHGQNQTYNNVLPGTGYSVVEDTLPAGWDFQSLNCSASSGVTPNISGATVTFDIDAPTDVLDCTYTNRARGNIVIRKVTDDGQGAFGFTSNTLDPASWTLTTTGSGDAGADSRTFSDLVPGTYDAAETVPAGWNLVSSSCDDGSDPSAIGLSGGETVTCTFHDARQQGAIDILKLRKHAADGPGDHPHPGVTFTVTGGELPAGGVTAVTDANGHACVSGLILSSFVGPYTVTESVPSGYHPEGNTSKTVSVTDEAAGCGDEPNPDADVQFNNIPLTNIVITVDSQINGGTASTINCDGTISGTDPNGDGGQTHNDLEPGTYTCTVVVDP
jgi:hypothetical protein